jgi:hypothetical protein
MTAASIELRYFVEQMRSTIPDGLHPAVPTSNSPATNPDSGSGRCQPAGRPRSNRSGPASESVENCARLLAGRRQSLDIQSGARVHNCLGLSVF